jgi:hypothetical protein
MSKRGIGQSALLMVVLASFAAGLMSSPASAASSVAWQIIQSPRPTNLVPGEKANSSGYPQFELFVENVGGADAPLGTTVTDLLPEGLSPSTVAKATWAYTPAGSNEQMGPCGVVGRTVTCTIPYVVSSGAPIKIVVPIDVASDASASVVNTATVEGGGALGSSQARAVVSDGALPFEALESPGLSATVADEAGGPPLAGSHPFVATFNVGVPAKPNGEVWSAVEPLRTVGIELPQGYVVNPMATKVRCTQIEASEASTSFPIKYCPQASQIGMSYLVGQGVLQHVGAPLYNMVPPPGAAADLTFEVENTVVHIIGGLSGGFHLTAKSQEIIQRFGVAEVSLVLWGVPSDPRFNRFRSGGTSCRASEKTAGCSIEPSPAPFITMPTSCTEPLNIDATVTSWLGSLATRSVPLTDREFTSYEPEGCNQLGFEPTIASRATTNAAETPSGLDFEIHQQQDESLNGRATTALKDVTVSLPEGLTLNPSAANGLGSCSEEQMGYAPAEGKIRFSTALQSCPNSSKVGTMAVKTPLLDHELEGSIYLGKPFDNPFHSLISLYLAVEDEESGIVAKLAGEVSPDPATGRLTAHFSENPELPLETIDLHFFEGVRGVLTTPTACGIHTTTSTLTPWSTPEGIDAHPGSSFETTAGCSASEAQAPKTVSFTAGTESPLSASYSPFVLRLTRPDGSQHITGIETTLPEGLLGKLAGVAYCPESGIAQARSREAPEKGKEEQQSPSCPASSEVGTVNVTAGSGIVPIPVSGHVYLAGPYKGAPLSLVVIVPAVAGPFDLGTVVDRVALNVGEYDARIRAVADPLPTIKDGIPLDVRSIELRLNRSGFTLNPSSCDAKAIEGWVSTQAGQSASLNNRFQVGECSRLAFKPKIAIALKGQTKKTGLPALTATVTYPTGGAYANIASAQVSLPHAEFLEQNNIKNACTKPVVQAGSCPASSVYGKVKAWTPLLDKPVEGNVYLVGGYGYKLPALVAELNGQIKVLLVGKIDTGMNKGIRNTFETVPDAPVEKFVLEMKGGKKFGLLVNSENICKKKQVAEASLTAQSGATLELKPQISTSCKSGKGKKKH